jgi:hypothetical protein
MPAKGDREEGALWNHTCSPCVTRDDDNTATSVSMLDSEYMVEHLVFLQAQCNVLEQLQTC